MKQTSILFLPFVALAIARRRGRFLVTAAITSLALVVPFGVDPGAFVEPSCSRSAWRGSVRRGDPDAGRS